MSKNNELIRLEKELSRLRSECYYKTNLLNQYEEQLGETQEAIVDAYSAIAEVRATKSYRISLLMRRFLAQFLKGDKADRRDFCRWICAKLCGSFAGKPLHEYDRLITSENLLQTLSDSNTSAQNELQIKDVSCVGAKTGRQIFIFASVPFYDVGGGQRSAQLANAFNMMGYEVHYLFGFDSSESKRKKMYIPAVKHTHIEKYSVQEMRRIIRKDAIFIFEIPYARFVPYLDYANENGHVTIYEHIDNWDSALGAMFYDPIVFKWFVDQAQHITVTAKILGEKIEEVGRQDYLYSANAVDSSLFEPSREYIKPEDLVIGKKTLLYFGSLWGEWFDWDLITHVAKMCDCEINLIGDYQPIISMIGSLPKNIHFLGIKKHEDLPAYLHHSDIALLPFKNSIIGKYVSPLKIFEYIAMNKPVLATPLDDIQGYPNVVLSEDKHEWAKVVDEGVNVIDATLFTAENSWFARCNKIIDFIGNRSDKKYPSLSIVVLNRNNMSVIFRCVSSLLTFSSAYDYEVIVVDNQSTDGSYELLTKKYGNQIKLIRNDKNGCSSGRNLGVKYAVGEMLLFLDSDQWVVGEHYLDAALELICTSNELGAVSWNAGWFDNSSCTGPIVDYLPNRGIIGPWALYRTDINYLATSGMLIRRDLFNEIGGFDELYDPTCFEDTDLSIKIKNAGYELAYCPYMNIMHLPHQTTNSGSRLHTELIRRNSEYFINKWKAINPGLLEQR